MPQCFILYLFLFRFFVHVRYTKGEENNGIFFPESDNMTFTDFQCRTVSQLVWIVSRIMRFQMYRAKVKREANENGKKKARMGKCLEENSLSLSPRDNGSNWTDSQLLSVCFSQIKSAAWISAALSPFGIKCSAHNVRRVARRWLKLRAGARNEMAV